MCRARCGGARAPPGVGATPETPPRLGPREKRQVVVAAVVRGRLPACLAAAWLLTRKVDGRAAGQQHAVHRGRTPPRQPLPAAHWYVCVCVYPRHNSRFVFLSLNDCVASFNIMKLFSVISFIHPALPRSQIQCCRPDVSFAAMHFLIQLTSFQLNNLKKYHLTSPMLVYFMQFIFEWVALFFTFLLGLSVKFKSPIAQTLNIDNTNYHVDFMKKRTKVAPAFSGSFF
jgi:hypothetical protein